MKIILVRHGESLANKLHLVTGDNQTDLTETGINQAIQLKDIVEELKFNFPEIVFHSSIALRAIKTASLAGVNPKILNTSKEINETDAGTTKNWKLSDFNNAYPSFFADFDLNKKYPQGESHQEMIDRSLSFLTSLLKGPCDCHMIFAHGGPINAILHYANNTSMSHFPAFQVANCQVIELNL
ncbi:MAG: histidine phosphatase family protein [Cyanobacteria bacterium J06554_1]